MEQRIKPAFAGLAGKVMDQHNTGIEAKAGRRAARPLSFGDPAPWSVNLSVFVGTCDLAGLVRGKGFPAAELASRLKKGVGLTHSNIMMSPFGPIYDTPFGTEGDLMLVPDRAPRSRWVSPRAPRSASTSATS